MAKAAEFAAKVAPVAREIDGTNRHIADVLNERGIAAPQSKRCHAASVRLLLRRVQLGARVFGRYSAGRS